MVHVLCYGIEVAAGTENAAAAVQIQDDINSVIASRNDWEVISVSVTASLSDYGDEYIVTIAYRERKQPLDDAM